MTINRMSQEAITLADDLVKLDRLLLSVYRFIEEVEETVPALAQQASSLLARLENY